MVDTPEGLASVMSLARLMFTMSLSTAANVRRNAFYFDVDHCDVTNSEGLNINNAPDNRTGLSRIVRSMKSHFFLFS